MMLGLKITCTCHQAKTAICRQAPLVVPFALKMCTGGFFNMLFPNCNRLCSLTNPGTQT